ncbi:ferredoxin--NADP reductase [Gordonia rhizosphera]|uniref:Putative oxidoreductase n=1 Tax=Gordonia rhizosphera NBRC 16068 TaxID=1108045 RepID=K6W7L0_9ACTN|nr:ferredoxin--NADP reductase [Gordonia rhizosphera]GAB89706.1 putative oxidoreductase [Gordonia rhizosphera NBRC 16068]
MARPPLFQRATVTRVVKETDDARTFTLEPEGGPLTYQAGQFCTFRVTVDGEVFYRSYSMSSAPEVDSELTTTVKRVEGGTVSNWILDNVAEGDVLEMTRAAGTFCLHPTEVPLLGFSGGSGITPVLSLTKSALATTDRQIRLLCADRDRESIIFDTAMADLVKAYPGRLTVVRSLDDENGYLTEAAIRDFVGDDTGADSYICGPEPFMALVESVLTGAGNIFVERFGTTAPIPGSDDADSETSSASDGPGEAVEDSGTLTIKLGRKKITVPRKPGETILESARRGGLKPPFSCEAGNCATCMARLDEGTATMRVNDALEDDEVDDGYVLTCQAVPDTANTVVDYED